MPSKVLAPSRGTASLHSPRPRASRRAGPGGGVWAGGLLGLLGLGGPAEEEEPLVLAVKRGILAIQEGDLPRADRLLHIALKMAQDLGREEAITHIFCLLGNLALERQLLGQAERLFKTVIQRLLAAGEPQDSNGVVELSLKLAGIYAATGRPREAEAGFQYCESSQLGKVVVGADPDTLGLAGLVLDRRAQFLLERGRLVEAEAAWREAVRVAVLLHGERGEQTLVVTNSLASLLSMRGRQAAAAELLVGVVAAAREQDSGHLPAFLVNLGLVQLQQGLAAETEALCGEARRLAGEVGDGETGDEAEACLTRLREALGHKEPTKGSVSS